jgi:2-amino-4-hydroxy-6-hydroxymethyldihydropteridine diphosphokinase
LHLTFIGLGSNVGERVYQLQQAKEALLGIHDTAFAFCISPLFETLPFGITEQPTFYNAVIALYTHLEPNNLLTFLKQTETTIGRTPRQRWGPREIDLDILAYENVVLKTENLIIPHPGIMWRAFVLIPWGLIVPGYILPDIQMSIETLAHRLPESDKNSVKLLTTVW